jgi:molybdopterin-guanine dinucleotide biosynthesis protein A
MRHFTMRQLTASGLSLSVPVDVHLLPGVLRAILCGTQAAVLDTQTAIGWWPVSLASNLNAHIRKGGRSLESWIAITQCRRVSDAAFALVNVNRHGDMLMLMHARASDVGSY